MGKPRSAIAVRGSTKALLAAALKAFSKTDNERAQTTNFDDAIDFTMKHCEELGGPEGEDTWHLWQEGEFAILGDLSLLTPKAQNALKELSKTLGELTVAMLDSSFGDIMFAVYADGDLKRLLAIEDGELYESGFPVVEERGHFDEEFDDEMLERLWTARKLPTFEHDPLTGPFELIVVK
jgi:hypothetical protein